MQKRSLALLIGWIALVAVAAGLGAFASRDAAPFYAQLSVPAWAPPGWLFGPVWTTLYILMAIAAWRVTRAPGSHRAAVGLFLAQLAANALWSWLFFAWHRGAASFADVVLLDALVIATVWRFARIDRIAAFLMLPYLAWIAFRQRAQLGRMADEPGAAALSALTAAARWARACEGASAASPPADRWQENSPARLRRSGPRDGRAVAAWAGRRGAR